MSISIPPNILFITLGRRPDAQILAEQYKRLSGGADCGFVHVNYAFSPGPREILSLIEKNLREGKEIVFDGGQSSLTTESICIAILKHDMDIQEAWKNKSREEIEKEKEKEAKKRLPVAKQTGILKRLHVLYDD